MNLTIEQKKEILDNAPTGATHIETKYRGHPYCKASNGELTDIYLDEWCSILPVKSISLIALEDLLADVITHEATEEEMKNIDSILVESDEALATEMSERDIPSFDDPIFVSPLDECASNEVDFWNGNGNPRFKQIVSDSKGALYEYYGLNSGCLVGKPWNEYGIVAHNKEYVAVVDGGYFKPESPQDKAKRERDENGKALYELANSLFLTPRVEWDDCFENCKEDWRNLAEFVTLKDEHKE